MGNNKFQKWKELAVRVLETQTIFKRKYQQARSMVLFNLN